MTPAATHREDLWLNASTHGLGFLASLVVLPWLIMQAFSRGDIWHQVSFSVFGVSLVLLFLASTAYHATSCPVRKLQLRLVDHAMIFLFIAASYTPYCLTVLRGPWGWALFSVAWIVALCGVGFKVFSKSRYSLITVLLYLAMAWMSMVAIQPLWASLSPMSLTLLLFAGGFFTLGIVFYVLDRRPGFHALWHLFVLAGCASLTGSVVHILPA